MKCSNCNRRMTPLFLSMACDWCDAPTQKTGAGGWVLRSEWNVEEYVFRSRIDCERWLEVSGRKGRAEPIMVNLAKPPIWVLSSGSLRDVVLAREVYILKHDHRHPVSEVPTCWPIV